MTIEFVHPTPFWDVYLLYDRNARWHDQPTQPVSSGSPIIGATDELSQALKALLGR
jgi:hypothetical protein